MKAKFYKCETCGNIIMKTIDSGVPVMCCGKPMQELVANTEDAALEKHVPAVKAEADKIAVVIGETEHPMLDAHYIQFIYLETEKGGQIKMLAPGEQPKATFILSDDRPVAVYEYCNIHGLWVKEL